MASKFSCPTARLGVWKAELRSELKVKSKFDFMHAKDSREVLYKTEVLEDEMLYNLLYEAASDITRVRSSACFG